MGTVILEANKREMFKKISGSTIVEVLVSLMIIMIVFVISSMIFLNVTRTGLSGKKERSRNALRFILEQTRREKSFTTNVLYLDSLKIYREVTSFSNNEALVRIHLTVFDNNAQKLCELEEIIKKRED